MRSPTPCSIRGAVLRMIGYSATHIFREEDRTLMQVAAEIVRILPERDRSGQELRCHEVARVVATALESKKSNLTVCDGHYMMAQHSWILICGDRLALDPYAVGRLPVVQLVDVGSLAVRGIYLPGPRREDIREDVIEALLRHLFDASSTAWPVVRNSLRILGHCEKSEQCIDDVYCNCPCVRCSAQDCHRPGCKCERRHA
jgi:hypothetical protein